MTSVNSTHQKLPSTTSAANDRAYRIVRRPARGFHRFRSGVLNVAPKGVVELKLFMDNQLSPLLRLPTEIRNTIWMHVLGGKTYRAMGFSGREVSQTYKFAPSAAEPRNGMALLRTCRQIYSETALYPMKSATFTYGHIVYLKRSIKSLKPYQRRQITHLQMECICYGNMITSCRQEVYQFNRHVRKKLPASTSMTVLFSETNIVAADIPQYVHPANEITDVTLSVMTTSSVLDPYYI